MGITFALCQGGKEVAEHRSQEKENKEEIAEKVFSEFSFTRNFFRPRLGAEGKIGRVRMIHGVLDSSIPRPIDAMIS